MKYKLIGIAMVVIMLITTFAAQIFPDFKKPRYQQHLDAEPKAACADHAEHVFCTHLPLVQITTEHGADIPGKTIGHDAGNVPIYSTTSDGADVIAATVAITDNAGKRNHLTDLPQLESRAFINVRGNSSRLFDKSGYAIRLVNDDGTNRDLSVMGMDAHHEWVLHGPYLDKTLMRNYMWYNIASEIMDYAPNVRFCEVTLNGEYIGLYVMMESITGGDNARIRLTVDKKHNRFSGYLLCLDRGSKIPMKNITPLSIISYRNQMKLHIVYPGTPNLTEEIRSEITQDFSDFEKALYSYDFDETSGYRNRIDVSSFATYFLINEFTSNYDAGWLSTYIYKGIDGKFRMCVWDFNSACNAYQEHDIDTTHFEMQRCIWYVMLTKDKAFVEEIISTYRRLRKTYFSEEYLNRYIDDVVAYLGDAIERNYEKWGYTFGEDYDLLRPTERNPRSYDEAITQMREFIQLRGRWMDENIETLRQYCADSSIKKFNENAN